MTLTLISPAFADGERIPEDYTRDGSNRIPPLKWNGVPQDAKSLALVVEDPDAPSGTFRHCAIYNIPRDRDGLGETSHRDGGLRFGQNDFGNMGYDGPEPPEGHGIHHYHFKLAALDVPSLSVPPQAGAEGIWREATKHAIAECELVGTYER